MISLNKADKKSYLDVKQELVRLYLSAFTEGISAQKITTDEAETYLDKLFSDGYGIFAFSDDQLIAALISIPLTSDNERPENIRTLYDTAAAEYIAEVLVDKNFREMGLGKKLMRAFEDHLDKKRKHVLLRVWNQNEAAVALYQKAGFKVCGHIVQEKIRPLTNDKFVMHKNYMVKIY
ncbi:GNAT family N-acetyltransferase [Psychroflexus sp. CAK8W]|uniref:GNAT family N-acetyltransferase n=1 Tax=Psychroflexus longus TaxID=2873596 RepID=A0ABS7XL58_9FLAO|nr:GNAT family N-acetyltransferase [Psychroflexus longus]MBZ9779500.1 GNAT family N-acetyltransferase [Psychroflexus longus]